MSMRHFADFDNSSNKLSTKYSIPIKDGRIFFDFSDVQSPFYHKINDMVFINPKIADAYKTPLADILSFIEKSPTISDASKNEMITVVKDSKAEFFNWRNSVQQRTLSADLFLFLQSEMKIKNGENKIPFKEFGLIKNLTFGDDYYSRKEKSITQNDKKFFVQSIDTLRFTIYYDILWYSNPKKVLEKTKGWIMVSFLTDIVEENKTSLILKPKWFSNSNSFIWDLINRKPYEVPNLQSCIVGIEDL